jgi:hypothetical protein
MWNLWLKILLSTTALAGILNFHKQLIGNALDDFKI